MLAHSWTWIIIFMFVCSPCVQVLQLPPAVQTHAGLIGESDIALGVKRVNGCLSLCVRWWPVQSASRLTSAELASTTLPRSSKGWAFIDNGWMEKREAESGVWHRKRASYWPHEPLDDFTHKLSSQHLFASLIHLVTHLWSPHWVRPRHFNQTDSRLSLYCNYTYSQTWTFGV